MTKQTFTLRLRWALGDCVCLSALIRDIQRAYPGKYRLLMTGHYSRVFWQHNPHCTPASNVEGMLVTPEYLAGIKAAGRGQKVHFLTWFHKDFEARTGVKVPVTEPKGDIHLSAGERRNRLFPFRYWVVVAGGKRDMTAKVWATSRFQQVVDTLATEGIRCVQAGAEFTNHFHGRLTNCDMAVGKTNSERDLFSLIYHAEGVICGITSFMHIAAVFDKPCVVIAGGREEPWWESYTNTGQWPEGCAPVKVPHRFLHTVGVLDCGCGNMVKGCWKDRVVPLDQHDLVNPRKRQQLCLRPLKELPQVQPECLHMITPEMVVAAVMSYYRDGILPDWHEPMKSKKHIWRLVETAEEVEAPVTVAPIAPAVPAAPPKPARPVELPREAQLVLNGGNNEFRVLDHPYLGGKVTIFVLCFGEYVQLAERCIGSILDTVPPDRRDLRVALNQPSPKLLDYVTAFPKDVVSKVYIEHGQRRKYQAMREMFWDPEHPITTPYVVWFDDDSHCVEPTWLVQLGREIVANHGHGCRLYGVKFVHNLMAYKRQGFNPEKWFQAASWWQGRPLWAGGGKHEVNNGSELIFCTGGFWALATETLRAADIPDVRLVHNGGDIVIGAQVHQAGGKIKDFSRNKRPIRWSDSPRRGYHENFPWTKIL